MERNLVARLMKENIEYLENAKELSKDPYTQVCCILFDGCGHKVAVGTNHEPKGWDPETFPWSDRALKNRYVIHAEVDACSKIDLNSGAPMYALVNLFPCMNCARLLIEHGIKQIYYRNIRFNEDASDVMTLCHMCNVKLVKI